MRYKLGIGVLLITAFGAPSAMASVISYSISFIGSGSPTAGSFTYDNDNPASPFFTAFSVTWDGINFDLTSSANAPSTNGAYPSCATGSGAAATFGLLLGDCFPTPSGVNTQWFGNVQQSPGEAYFSFITTVIATDKWFQVAGFTPSNNTSTASGVWSVSESVPEPGSFILVGTAICAVRARRRIVDGLRQAARMSHGSRDREEFDSTSAVPAIQSELSDQQAVGRTSIR
jgi:hypothetical protein